MRRISRLGWTAYAIAVGVIALDQAVKFWILYGFNLPARLTTPVIGPFSLTMVWNKGVSFGLFRADQDLGRWLLSLFSLVVAAALAWWARRTERGLMSLALGLIIGGAVGNAIDRIRFGAVVDFLDFSRLMFPWVFNVADSAISVGVALLLVDSLMSERKPTS
ncbi:signal peptidase II [Phenylobacterium sp.]|uniref:signal peptidase II n=1 Tax=Phenylobacterium sp. TaxID=1871053 RepID=UPI0035B21C94